MANSNRLLRRILVHKYIPILLTTVMTVSNTIGKHKDIENSPITWNISIAPFHLSPYSNKIKSSAQIYINPAKRNVRKDITCKSFNTLYFNASLSFCNLLSDGNITLRIDEKEYSITKLFNAWARLKSPNDAAE